MCTSKLHLAAAIQSDLGAQRAVWYFCKAETIQHADKAAAQLVHTMLEPEVRLLDDRGKENVCHIGFLSVGDKLDAYHAALNVT